MSQAFLWQSFSHTNTDIYEMRQPFLPGGGTQYKGGYRDVPQTWVAKSGRQVHQWVPFFSKTWYFDGSIFQNFLKFAPKWRKFGTLIGQLFKIFRNLRQNGANSSEKFWFLVHGWVTFPSKGVHGWVAFQKSQRHTPTQTKVEYPPGHFWQFLHHDSYIFLLLIKDLKHFLWTCR